MIIMANEYCHDGYCDLSPKEVKESSKTMPVNDQLSIIGLSLFLAVISGLLVWYGAAHGIYVDPASLQ